MHISYKLKIKESQIQNINESNNVEKKNCYWKIPIGNMCNQCDLSRILKIHTQF